MPPADGSSTTVASRYLSMWLDLTTTHRQTWLFSCTSKYHSTDLLTARGVAHLVVHRTSGSTSYETIPPVRLETSGGVLSTVDIIIIIIIIKDIYIASSQGPLMRYVGRDGSMVT